ncbi:MAG TPA: SPOR domain-containing protein [Gammaproteobacteria bacterium]|nr:SPOR domain-containing protein [Gammaproteobacteria bacterium]
MEPHVKERIVGAAILVALGVWIIPWVLDGPDEAIEASEAVSDELLPASDDTGPVRSETVELDPAPPAPSSRAARAPDAASAAELARDEASVAAAEIAGEDGSGTGDAAAPAGAGTDDRVAAVVAADGDAQAQPDPAAAAPARSAAAVSATGRDGWAVQLGAFGDLANAHQLASRVSTYGYSAYVSEFRSGGETMHRVRVGGFDSENEADAAAGSLSAHGFPGRVISPE